MHPFASHVNREVDAQLDRTAEMLALQVTADIYGGDTPADYIIEVERQARAALRVAINFAQAPTLEQWRGERPERDHPALDVVCPVCRSIEGRPCRAQDGTLIDPPHFRRVEVSR